MNHQNKTRKWPRMLAKLGITIFLVVLFHALGAGFRGRIPGADMWAAITLIALLVLLGASIAASFFYNKKFEQMKVRDIHEFTEDRRSRMAADTGREARRLRRACVFAATYLALLAVLSLALCFFSGAAGGSGGTAPVLTLYVLYGIVARFFTEKPKADRSRALPEAQYPLLYQTARKAADSPSADICIFLGAPTPEQECNASITQEGNTIHLLLGPTLLCVLSQEELYQVLRHEFAHIGLAHTSETLQYTKLMDFLAGDDDSTLGIWTSWALRFPLSYLALEGQYYFLLSSRDKETHADEVAGNSGNAAEQASALAKLSTHSLFCFEQEPHTCIYRSETVPEHFATDRVHLFREALRAREADWRVILENQIPARVATHPTFRQRWEALGCCDYTLTPAPEQGDFAAECWAAAAECDRRMREISQENYSKIRQEEYLDHLKIVQDYEAGGTLLPPEDMRPVIYGYYTLAMPDKAEALCDQIIAAYDSPFSTAFAKYWKGILMFSRYDKAGLEYLYQAMEANTNYIDDGLEKIGSFCTMMGLAQELEEYRARALDFMQQLQDHSTGGITAKAKLSPETLPEDWQERILAYILQAGGGKIAQVYLVREQSGEDYSPSSFVLRYTGDASDEQRLDIYDKVFRLLDDWPTDWEFCLYDYQPSMEKPLQRVPGSCIYDAQK